MITALAAGLMTSGASGCSVKHVHVQPTQPAIISMQGESAGANRVPLGIVHSSPAQDTYPISQGKPWSRLEEARFLTLASTYAAGSLPQSEITAYERLRARRRSFHHPRSPEDVMLEYRNSKIEEALAEALSQYVTFVSAKNRSQE
jgi:hypothetical protein